MSYFKITKNKNSKNQENALAEIKELLEKRGLSGVVLLFENGNVAKDSHLHDNLNPLEAVQFCAAMMLAGEFTRNAFQNTFESVSKCDNPMCQNCRQKVKDVRDN